jgi:nucleoside-diphosphate-sugar epimerase
VLRGSITDEALLAEAVQGIDAVLHLAALLPPASERDRALTMAVNVEGTRALLRALATQAPAAHLVFSSSVCVYGDTSGSAPPVRAERAPAPLDLYGESKATAETIVRGSGQPYSILRISGIAVPAFLAPPAVWPFQAEQRIEFIARGDVVRALMACLAIAAPNRILNIAGGATWRMTGAAYVARWCEALGLDPAEAPYLEQPGTFDWYETGVSQALLGYQQTSFEELGALLDAAVEQALGEEVS